MPSVALSRALDLIKQGFLVAALHELSLIKDNLTGLTANEIETLSSNYELVLHILFDRALAAAEEAFSKEDEISTALSLINLGNLYSRLHAVLLSEDKATTKKFRSMALLFEKWALKVLTQIRSSDLQKRHRERRFDDILGMLSFSLLLFIDYLIPLIEEVHRTSYDLIALERLIQPITKEIANYFTSQLERAIKAGDLISSVDLLQNISIIQSSTTSMETGLFPLKMTILGLAESEWLNLQLKVLELHADFDLSAAGYFRQEQQFEESITHYRTAYSLYGRCSQTQKQQKTKEDYLYTVILSSKADLKTAQIKIKANQESEAFFSFQQALDKLDKINAKKEYIEAKARLLEYYSFLGDESCDRAAEKGKSTESFSNLAYQLHYYQKARAYYLKADNLKKQREIETIVQRLQTQRMRILRSDLQEARRVRDYEREFLLLEDLHILSYELENPAKAQGYAKDLEKLKEKLDQRRLDQLRAQSIEIKLGIAEPPSPPSSMPPPLPLTPGIILPEISSSEQLPDIFAQQLPTTTPNFITPNSHDAPQASSSTMLAFPSGPSTISRSPSGDQTIRLSRPFPSIFTPSPVPSPPISADLKQVYAFVKKFNQRAFLSSAEIQTLQAFGVNLPTAPFYFYRFPKVNHHFYVHESSHGQPRVLMFPTRDLIKRKVTFAWLMPRIENFIPSEKKTILPAMILEIAINYAINHPNWSTVIDGFQYSTLDVFFYFLHAVRLYSLDAPAAEVAKYFNSSIIAEYLNTSTEDLTRYIFELSKIGYFEEIFAWSTNQIFRLFFLGLNYIRKRQFRLAALLFSMLLIS